MMLANHPSPPPFLVFQFILRRNFARLSIEGELKNFSIFEIWRIEFSGRTFYVSEKNTRGEERREREEEGKGSLAHT